MCAQSNKEIMFDNTSFSHSDLFLNNDDDDNIVVKSLLDMHCTKGKSVIQACSSHDVVDCVDGGSGPRAPPPVHSDVVDSVDGGFRPRAPPPVHFVAADALKKVGKVDNINTPVDCVARGGACALYLSPLNDVCAQDL